METRNVKNLDANSFLWDLNNSQWSGINSDSGDVNEAWQNWKSVSLSVLAKPAPKRVIKVQNKPAPCLNSEIKKQMFTRDYLKRKAMKSASKDHWDAYKRAKTSLNCTIRRAKLN